MFYVSERKMDSMLYSLTLDRSMQNHNLNWMLLCGFVVLLFKCENVRYVGAKSVCWECGRYELCPEGFVRTQNNTYRQ